MRRDRESGIALIMVIVVLLALVAIATPFTVSMQLQEKTSRMLLQRHQARLLAESFSVANDSLRSRVALLQATPSILPTSGWLSSRFNRSRVHPILNESRPHYGVDIAATAGAPILAAAGGRVVRAGWVPGLGQMVEIDHGYGYVTRYGHASRLHVRPGQNVERGQLIAEVGSSGLATGPHLHYEIYVNGEPENPMNFVLPDAAP